MDGMKNEHGEPLIRIDVLFGHVELDDWFEPRPDGSLAGMSRRRVYDRDGRLTEVSEPEQTGAILRFM